MTVLRASHLRHWACCLILTPILLFALSPAAEASLIGDEVRIQVGATDATFEVVSGVDPDFSVSSFHWNVESSSFVFWISSIPGGSLAPGVFFTLSDLDFTPPAVIVDATIVGAAGLFIDAMDDILAVSADSIVVDLSSFAGGSLSGGNSMEIVLSTEVPEPAGAMLVLTGASVLLGAARARTRRSI